MHRVRDTLGSTLLVAIMATLVFAAWPTEIRPAFLDDANMMTQRVLFYGLGVTAGQPLFHAGEHSDWVRRAFCVKVRGQYGDAPGASSLIHPPTQDCQVDGFRIRLPPVDRALHRILVWAYDASGSGSRPGSASDQHLAGIARHFCQSPGPAGERQRSISLIWYWYFEHYANGRLRRTNALQLGFDCLNDRMTERTWMSDDATFAGFWGSEPWE